MWFLPISILVFTTLLAIPLSRYMAWIMDGRYNPPAFLRWFERRLDSGGQTWKQYAAALLIFNIAMFIYGFIVLAVQARSHHSIHVAWGYCLRRLSSTASRRRSDDSRSYPYSGDRHLVQLEPDFLRYLRQFVSAAVGLCALTAIIRCFRAEKNVGNFFVDMWRVIISPFIPVALVLGILFMQQGMPMTYQSTNPVTTLEPAAMGTADNGQPKQQTLVVGPVASVIPIKMIGTNGGGFYGMNSAIHLKVPAPGPTF